MPRIARVVMVGRPHHITQRGNYQQDVFCDENDRTRYLAWIEEYSKKYGMSILAYCLMQNHVHFIVIPEENISLAKTFNTAHMRYAQYFNKKFEQRGHLWQGRFYSCVLDEQHLILAARYIERNPVRAGLTNKPWQWLWSSALFHTGKKVSGSVSLGNFLEFAGMTTDAWKRYIDSSEEETCLQRIRKFTLTGRPLGDTEFIEGIEKVYGRKLLALPKGRPKNETKMVAVPI